VGWIGHSGVSYSAPLFHVDDAPIRSDGTCAHKCFTFGRAQAVRVALVLVQPARHCHARQALVRQFIGPVTGSHAPTVRKQVGYGLLQALVPLLRSLHSLGLSILSPRAIEFLVLGHLVGSGAQQLLRCWRGSALRTSLDLSLGFWCPLATGRVRP